MAVQLVGPGGQPIGGANLQFTQISQDFMFSTGWRWRGDQVSHELVDRFNEIGFNTGHLLLYYMWEGAQPTEEEFDWTEIDHAMDTFGTTLPPDELPNLRHRYVVLGPPFGQLGVGPDWVETDDLATFQEQYGAFLMGFLERYRHRLDIYVVLHELEGTLSGLSKEETLDWIRWQIGLIRAADPESVVLIQTGDTHWYFPGEDEIDIGEFTTMPKTVLMEWLIENEVDFDGLAVETHYSMAAPGDWHQMDEAIRSLTDYGKYIYVWEVYYPSQYEPCLFFNWMDRALTPEIFPAQWPLSPETYTEAWQADQVLHSLQALMANPYVLGINYGTLAGADFVDGYTDSPGFGFGRNLCDERHETHLGLLREDYSPKPGFISLRDYWHSLFSQGSLTSDDQGLVEWAGMPGEYQITVTASGYQDYSAVIDVDRVSGTGHRIELEPVSEAAGQPLGAQEAGTSMPERGEDTQSVVGEDAPGNVLCPGVGLFLAASSIITLRFSKPRSVT